MHVSQGATNNHHTHSIGSIVFEWSVLTGNMGTLVTRWLWSWKYITYIAQLKKPQTKWGSIRNQDSLTIPWLSLLLRALLTRQYIFPIMMTSQIPSHILLRNILTISIKLIYLTWKFRSSVRSALLTVVGCSNAYWRHAYSLTTKILLRKSLWIWKRLVLTGKRDNSRNCSAKSAVI